jgi:threonyl-tRNA synthetase
MQFCFTDIHDYLSTRLEKSVGDPECWKAAEAALEKPLKQAHIEYDVDQGGSDIYGLKIDLKIKDALSHEWQFSTSSLTSTSLTSLI